MASRAVAVAPDVDDVATVEKVVQPRGAVTLVMQDVVPVLETLVADSDRVDALPDGITVYWLCGLQSMRSGSGRNALSYRPSGSSTPMSRHSGIRANSRSTSLGGMPLAAI